MATDPLSLADDDTLFLHSLHPRRLAMTSLQQRLEQLTVTTISQQLESTLAETATCSLRVVQTQKP